MLDNTKLIAYLLIVKVAMSCKLAGFWLTGGI